MHKIKHDNISKSIKTCFKESKNKYNTKASKITFTKPFCRSKSTQFSINFRGPHLYGIPLFRRIYKTYLIFLINQKLNNFVYT